MFAFISRLVAIGPALLIACCSSAAAKEAPVPARADVQSAEKTETIKLAITPAAEPLPALRYRLHPTFADRRPGNAAPLYAQAGMHYDPTDDEAKRIDELLKSPRAEFDRFAASDESKKYAEASPIALLRVAANRDSCDWELPLREQNIFEVLLPEQQELRQLARLLALQARLQGAKGRYAEAIERLRIGYVMAHHDGKSPTLINGLVGISIARMMNEVVLDLAQRAGAPNLYWALTTRPTPLVDLRPGLEAEMCSLELAVPQMRAAVEKDPRELSADAGLAEMFKFWNTVVSLEGNTAGSDTAEILRRATLTTLAIGMVMVRAEEIRDYLQTCGLPRERVERMGNAQLLLAYDKLKFDELRDQTFRWMMLPYPQAKAGFAGAYDRLRDAARNKTGILPWAGLLLPTVLSVHWTHADAQREADVLRLVEALRMHAANHAGKLPKSLDELNAVTPIPPDGITGKPFEYQLTGDVAKLTLRDDHPSRSPKTKVYEITVAK